jgi:hypothetical protein
MISLRESKIIIYDLLNIVKVAGADISLSLKMVKKNQKQFWRRTFIRSLFAGIEGINHRINNVSILLANIQKIKLSHAEIAMLKEETYALNEKGEAISTKSKLRTKDNLCFTLKTFAHVSNTMFKIEKNSKEWSSFNEALKIRDRLTHPKSTNDLIISDVELEAVEKTFMWYFASIIAILNSAKKSLETLLANDAKENKKKRQSNKTNSADR